MTKVSDTIDIKSDSKEYKLGCAVAATLRDRTNSALGDVLTLIEASLGESPQSQALKQMVKQTFWKMTDANQHTVYYAFGQEPKQIGDSHYIQDIIDGVDNPLEASPSLIK